MSYTTYIEQALNKDTKTCTKCGLDKTRDNFSCRNTRCNTCNANRIVTCGCGRPEHKRIPESEMEIYAVRIDTYNKGVGTYFKSQKCLTRTR